MTHCPKCDADIDGTYEGADPSVGMMSGGYYCDACDLAIGEHEVEHEPMPGDVPISFARAPGEPLGTKLSEMTDAKFVQIARSWGYD